jgi:DHA3 family macrolide efflux protein-like MFS transporter
MSDPVTSVPDELRAPPARPPRALVLLRPPDFRRLYLAVAASELGDSLHYIALMWFAFDAGGPLGVVAVRLADSVPAFLFGLHGGLAADRFDRRLLMIGADLVRAAVLVPIALLGLAGHLPLAALVAAAFLLEAATSYFAPAYGALVPALVERKNVQQANALVQATIQALSVGGWALAAVLVAVVPLSTFFAVNAASFFVSAALISRVAVRRADRRGEGVRLREGFAALRPRPTLAVGVAVLAVAGTVSSGTWIGGVPTLVRDALHRGAGGFSVVMVGYALGSIASGLVLARLPVRRKALASQLAWTLYLPGYGLMVMAGSLPIAIAGAFAAALGQSSARVLLMSAAQEEMPDSLLGRVVGLISLTHRGAHATGLLLVSPLFAFVAPRGVFAAAALALPLIGLTGVALSTRLVRRREERQRKAPLRRDRAPTLNR